ncbi:hypothetical protein [Microcoleus vaginatus]|uniref:hypothetical protein n=1 Tax=Microcoleus vaginatus TaxID=119532 RepID=UPI0002DBAFC2
MEKFGIEKKGIDDIEGRRKFGNGLCNGCNGCNGCQEEGSSATDYVTDVTDVRKKEEGSF